MTEDEIIGWHLDSRHEFEQTLGDSEEQESLACCSPCDLKEPDTTEQLNNNSEATHSAGCTLCLTSGQKLGFC